MYTVIGVKKNIKKGELVFFEPPYYLLRVLNVSFFVIILSLSLNLGVATPMECFFFFFGATVKVNHVTVWLVKIIKNKKWVIYFEELGLGLSCIYFHDNKLVLMFLFIYTLYHGNVYGRSCNQLTESLRLCVSLTNKMIVYLINLQPENVHYLFF